MICPGLLFLIVIRTRSPCILIRDIAQGITSQNPYFDCFRKHRNITELSRGIVAELIDVIHIHEGGDFEIAFAFADQHRRALEFTQSHSAKEEN